MGLFRRAAGFYRKTRKILRRKMLRLAGRAPPLAPTAHPLDWRDADSIMLAVLVTGGLGDFIVVARLLRDLCARADNLKLHIYSPAHSTAAAWVFRSVREVAEMYDESFFFLARANYDSALVFNQLAYHYGESANYQKIARLSPRLLDVLKSLNSVRPQWDGYIQRHPFLDGGMAHTAVALGETRYSLLHTMVGVAAGEMMLDLEVDDSVANELRRRHGHWITISNGFDANFLIGSRTATKCYPQAHWNSVVALIKQARPDVALVHVGSKNSEPINRIDENLLGRTSLPQVAGVIRGSLLHVDNEGGLVHLATSLGRTSVVLFGPTSIRYFSYPGNHNLSSGFCGDCWWSKKTWMEACPRGYGSALCMDRLAPEAVAARVLKALPVISGQQRPPDNQTQDRDSVPLIDAQR